MGAENIERVRGWIVGHIVFGKRCDGPSVGIDVQIVTDVHESGLYFDVDDSSPSCFRSDLNIHASVDHIEIAFLAAFLHSFWRTRDGSAS